MTAAEDICDSGFCRGCGYALRGLIEPRCPECGRAFDPANPRTFDRAPRISYLKRRARQLAALLLGAVLLYGGSCGFLYWGWRGEQAAIAQVRSLGGWVGRHDLGGEWLRKALPKQLWFLTERVHAVHLDHSTALDEDLRHLASFSGLEDLKLISRPISGEGLRYIRSLKTLRGLHLDGTHTTDSALRHIAGLHRLEWLGLSNTRVTDAGLAHVEKLVNLRELFLYNTAITDEGLVHLRPLVRLRLLYLMNTSVSDAGLQHLAGMSDLRQLRIEGTKITPEGVKGLRP